MSGSLKLKGEKRVPKAKAAGSLTPAKWEQKVVPVLACFGASIVVGKPAPLHLYFHLHLQVKHRRKAAVQSLLNLVVECADISHAAKPTQLHLRWSVLITEEFYQQGTHILCCGWRWS